MKGWNKEIVHPDELQNEFEFLDFITYNAQHGVTDLPRIFVSERGYLWKCVRNSRPDICGNYSRLFFDEVIDERYTYVLIIQIVTLDVIEAWRFYLQETPEKELNRELWFRSGEDMEKMLLSIDNLRQEKRVRYRIYKKII